MCISFSCKTKWNSYMYIYPPSWTSFSCPYPTLLGHHRAPSWAPCATQQLPLLIYFTHGGIHMSMLPSQFVPPSLCPSCSQFSSLCLSSWMDKKRWHIYYIYNGILLSHKKDWNWVFCRDVDEPGVCHTEWTKLEREKEILILMHIYGNLGKWNYL